MFHDDNIPEEQDSLNKEGVALSLQEQMILKKRQAAEEEIRQRRMAEEAKIAEAQTLRFQEEEVRRKKQEEERAAAQKQVKEKEEEKLLNELKQAANPIEDETYQTQIKEAGVQFVEEQKLREEQQEKNHLAEEPRQARIPRTSGAVIPEVKPEFPRAQSSQQPTFPDYSTRGAYLGGVIGTLIGFIPIILIITGVLFLPASFGGTTTLIALGLTFTVLSGGFGTVAGMIIGERLEHERRPRSVITHPRTGNTHLVVNTSLPEQAPQFNSPSIEVTKKVTEAPKVTASYSLGQSQAGKNEGTSQKENIPSKTKLNS